MRHTKKLREINNLSKFLLNIISHSVIYLHKSSEAYDRQHYLRIHSYHNHLWDHINLLDHLFNGRN